MSFNLRRWQKYIACSIRSIILSYISINLILQPFVDKSRHEYRLENINELEVLDSSMSNRQKQVIFNKMVRRIISSIKPKCNNWLSFKLHVFTSNCNRSTYVKWQSSHFGLIEKITNNLYVLILNNSMYSEILI